MPARICKEPGCDMPAWETWSVCPRHLLTGKLCIVPGCQRERLHGDPTCFMHWLDEARIVVVPDETREVVVSARGRA